MRVFTIHVVLFYIAVITTMTKSNLRNQVYFILHFIFHHNERTRLEFKEGTWSQELMQKTETNVAYWLGPQNLQDILKVERMLFLISWYTLGSSAF